MRRGDLVTVARAGDFGKPHPAVAVQSDLFDGAETVTVLLLSGTGVDAPLLRPEVRPTSENGLRRPSQVMVDKVTTVRRARVGAPFGRLDDATMPAVTRSMAVFLGIA